MIIRSIQLRPKSSVLNQRGSESESNYNILSLKRIRSRKPEPKSIFLDDTETASPKKMMFESTKRTNELHKFEHDNFFNNERSDLDLSRDEENNSNQVEEQKTENDVTH